MAIHCSDIETLVHTYLDGELADHDLDEFEAHTSECEACHARLEEEKEFRTDLRRRLAPPRAPAQLRGNLMAALDREDAEAVRVERSRRFSWVLPGAATLAAAAALLLFVQTQTQRPSAHMPVTYDAVKSHLHQQPIEVQGASAVSPWIKEHFEPTVAPPRFNSSDISLRGARLSHLRERDAAQLFYEIDRGHRRHAMQVHILNGANLDMGSAVKHHIAGHDLWVDHELGYSVVTYKDPSDGMAYVFTSDMSAKELLDLVAGSDLLLRTAERP